MHKIERGLESGLVFLHLHLEIRVSATSKEIRISDFGLRNRFINARFEKNGISFDSGFTTCERFFRDSASGISGEPDR